LVGRLEAKERGRVVTAMRPTARGVVVFVTGLLVGGAAGAITVLRFVMPQQAMNSYLVAQELETQSYLRYRFGREDVAAKSLEAYVDLLQRDAEHLRRLQPNGFGRRLGIAYARLALIAERSGDQGGRDHFFERARMQFAILGSKVTVGDLRDIVRAADENWDRETKERPVLGTSALRAR
jgi:hypothetical protein